MLKKLIIIIPIVVVLLIPTLIISSSAASITAVNGIVIDDLQARIGVPVNNSTYWSPFNTLFKRINLDNNRLFQIMLSSPEGDILHATTRVFSFNLYFDELTEASNFEFTISCDGSFGNFQQLGSYIRVEESINTDSPFSNIGSVIVTDGGHSIKFRLTNVLPSDIVKVDFAFNQIVASTSLIFDGNISPGLTKYIKDNPYEHLAFTTGDWSHLFPIDYYDGYFIYGSKPDVNIQYGIKPSVSGGSTVIRLYNYSDLYPNGVGDWVVKSANVTMSPFWLDSFPPFYIYDTRWYNVRFTVKLGNSSQISYANYISSVLLTIESERNTAIIKPSETFTKRVGDTEVSFAKFDFSISGHYLMNSKWRWDFYDKDNLGFLKSYISFYLSEPFELYALSNEYSETLNNYDVLINYVPGSYFEPSVNDLSENMFSDSLNDIQNVQNQFAFKSSVLDDLRIKLNDVFLNSNFIAASNQINLWYTRLELTAPLLFAFIFALLCVFVVWRIIK